MFIPHTILRDGDANGQGAGGASSANQSGGFNPFVPSNEPAQTQSQPQQDTSSNQGTTQGTGQQTASTQTAQGGQSTVVQPNQQQQPASPQPPAVALTPDQLQQLMAAARQPGNAAAQGQPTMSDSDFKKAFNVYEASQADFEATFGVKPTDAQLVAYNAHLQGVSRQSITIMRYLMEQRAREIENRFAPVQQTVQQQAEQQASQKYFTEFVAEYPGLKDYGPLLRDIIDAARARNMNFKSIDEAKLFVANQAARSLNKQVADFKIATSQSNGQSSQQSATRTMSTTSMGGRSGSSGGAAPSQSTAERIFS